MREVAQLAQVSVKTVSRVFNNDPHVLPETRTRVETVLRELHYVPNTVATTFRRGRVTSIGVAVPDLADPFFSAVAKAVDQVASENGMTVFIADIGWDAAAEAAALEALISRQPGGLVIVPTSTDQGYLRQWAERIPLVFVDRCPVDLDADSFTENDHAGAYLATRHLAEHGHRSIAFFGDSFDITTVRNRFEGYQDALRDAGLVVDEDLVFLGATDATGAEEAVSRLSAHPASPTAIFSSNARCTMHLVPAVAGGHWAIVGFGDFPMANMLSPGITVIDQDPVALGRMAAQRVVDRIEQPDRHYQRRNILPVRLRERESCGWSAAEPGLFPRSSPAGRSFWPAAQVVAAG
ncbi:LacI family DNA-binding transcriptional regulator [Kineococcus gynurae]|uniref:LacI family DNA-binding transcriptional regulator n=1 Tax=Kineococcus gynurae TaxID=452979 RepID=A0ABV5LNM8_9ACTN